VTISDALQFAVESLRKLESPRLEANRIVAHAARISTSELMLK
jgi:hypothetical protein